MSNTESFVNNPRVYTLENLYFSFDARLSNIESDVTILKADVAELKSDVNTLKSDVAELKANVSTLKADIVELKSDIKDIKTMILHSNELNEVRYQNLSWTIGACFGAIAVIAALVALVGIFKGNSTQHNHYSIMPRKNIPWARR